MDYGVDMSKRTVKRCDITTCRALFMVRAVVPVTACEACMARMRETFWEIWNKAN